MSGMENLPFSPVIVPVTKMLSFADRNTTFTNGNTVLFSASVTSPDNVVLDDCGLTVRDKNVNTDKAQYLTVIHNYLFCIGKTRFGRNFEFKILQKTCEEYA